MDQRADAGEAARDRLLEPLQLVGVDLQRQLEQLCVWVLAGHGATLAREPRGAGLSPNDAWWEG